MLSIHQKNIILILVLIAILSIIFFYYYLSEEDMTINDNIRISEVGVNSSYAGTFPFKIIATDGRNFYVDNFKFSNFLKQFESKPVDVEIYFKKVRKFPTHFLIPANEIVSAKVDAKNILDGYVGTDFLALVGKIHESDNRVFISNFELSQKKDDNDKVISIPIKRSELLNSLNSLVNPEDEIVIRGKLLRKEVADKQLGDNILATNPEYIFDLTGWYFLNHDNKRLIVSGIVLEPFNQNDQGLIPVFTTAETESKLDIFVDSKADTFKMLKYTMDSYERSKNSVELSLEKLHLVKTISENEAYVLVGFPVNNGTK